MALIWKKKTKWFLEEIYMNLNKPSVANKVILFRLLAATQNAWLGIRESLTSIQKAETHPWVKKILNDVLSDINEWVWFADALWKYDDFFTSSEIELIRSSESMWNLPETLDSMSIELEKFQIIRWKIKSAMAYPTVVILISILAVIVLLRKVVPAIVEMFPPELPLPWITQFVIAASDFVQNNYFILMALIISVPILYHFSYKNILPFKIFVDKLLLKMPLIWWLLMTFYRYRFSKLLWDFYNAWISPLDSLKQIANIFSNYHYMKKILDVRKDLEVWLEMADSFEWSWLFNPILVQIMWIWEKTWNIWEVLTKMSDFYRNELDTRVEWLTKVIEPLLMVFVAGVIWVIVASIFLPMGDLIWSLTW